MPETLSSVLKRKREELSFTLRQVQESTGISNAYLSQLENGKITSPTPAILKKLADCYKTSYVRLLELAGHPIVPEKSTYFRTSSGLEDLTQDEERELVKYLRYLRSRRDEQ